MSLRDGAGWQPASGGGAQISCTFVVPARGGRRLTLIRHCHCRCHPPLPSTTATAAATAADGPPPPYAGALPAQPRMAALGRSGAPEAAAWQASAASELLPLDDAGLPIASAAWVGLGPSGQPVLQPLRRSLSQAGAAALPRSKFVNNTLVINKMTTIIIPSACHTLGRRRLGWARNPYAGCACARAAAAAATAAATAAPKGHRTLPLSSLPHCAVSANESTGAICPGTSKPRGCPNYPCTAAQLKKFLFSDLKRGGNPAGDTVARGFQKVGRAARGGQRQRPLPSASGAGCLRHRKLAAAGCGCWKSQQPRTLRGAL